MKRAESVECLPRMHEDLLSVPRTYVKRWLWYYAFIIISTEKAGWLSLKLADQPVQPNQQDPWWKPQVLNFSGFLSIAALYYPFWAIFRKAIRILLQNLNIKIIGPFPLLHIWLHSIFKAIQTVRSYYLVLWLQKFRWQTLKCQSWNDTQLPCSKWPAHLLMQTTQFGGLSSGRIHWKPTLGNKISSDLHLLNLW